LLSAKCAPTCSGPVGYNAVGDKYYKLFKNQAKHLQALKTCREVGAWLAMFKTTEDFDAVKYYRTYFVDISKFGNNKWYQVLRQMRCG